MFRKFGQSSVFVQAIQALHILSCGRAVLTLDSGQQVEVTLPEDYTGTIEEWCEDLCDQVIEAREEAKARIGGSMIEGESFLQSLAAMFGAPPGVPITTAAAPPDDDTPMIPFDNPEGDSPREGVASSEGVAIQAPATPTSESKPKSRRKTLGAPD